MVHLVKMQTVVLEEMTIMGFSHRQLLKLTTPEHQRQIIPTDEINI